MYNVFDTQKMQGKSSMIHTYINKCIGTHTHAHTHTHTYIYIYIYISLVRKNSLFNSYYIEDRESCCTFSFIGPLTLYPYIIMLGIK